MPSLLRIHTLGDYRDAIEATADYPEAGTGSHRAQCYLALGLHSEVGAIAEQYRRALRKDHGVLTVSRLARIKDSMSSVLWYITRSVTEHGTKSAGLLWGHSIAELHPALHADSPANAWLRVPRVVIQTDFTELHDVQVMLRTLGAAAARHGWTIQDLGWHGIAKAAHTLQGATA